MNSDYLYMVAEIGAAFAGFAGLVGAISRRGDRSPEQEEYDFKTLRNVLLLSLFAVASALLPNLLEGVGLGESLGWRAAAATYTAGVGIYVYFTLSTLPGAFHRLGRPIPWSWYFNAGLIISTILLLALCALGLVPLRLYPIGPSVLLFASGTGFVRLFQSMRPVNASN